MRKFEYKTVQIKPKGFFGTELDPNVIDMELNELGQQGWELVTIQGFELNGMTTSYHCTFKREKL